LSYSPALQFSTTAFFSNAANTSRSLSRLPNHIPPMTERSGKTGSSAEQRKRHLQKSQLTLSVLLWHIFDAAALKLTLTRPAEVPAELTR